MIHKKISLYENREDVVLTTYILEATNNINFNQPRPSVLICPGGAYLYTSEREGEPIALAFNQMGYHAFVLDYSTHFSKKSLVRTDQKIELRPEVHFPAPIIEIAEAMLIIHNHSAEWGVDTRKIGLAGFSAGAHAVAMYGNQFMNPQLTYFSLDDTHDLLPAFMILGYGLFNVEKGSQMAKSNTEMEFLSRVMTMTTLGKTEATQEELRLWSPTYHINEKTPPAFIWSTVEDQVVSVADSLEYALAMNQAGRPYEIHVYQQGPHGLATAGPTSANENNHINPHVSTWLPLAATWIKDIIDSEV